MLRFPCGVKPRSILGSFPASFGHYQARNWALTQVRAAQTFEIIFMTLGLMLNMNRYFCKHVVERVLFWSRVPIRDALVWTQTGCATAAATVNFTAYGCKLSKHLAIANSSRTMGRKVSERRWAVGLV